jgi:hypothetical protein
LYKRITITSLPSETLPGLLYDGKVQPTVAREGKDKKKREKKTVTRQTGLKAV